MSHEKQPFLGISWLYSQYMWVWAALLVLTVVEVIVPEPSLIGLAKFPRVVVVLSLILLALMKTFFVAYYYMHLIDEKPSIILIACAPFIFSIFLTIGIWPQRSPKGEEVKQKKSDIQSVEDDQSRSLARQNPATTTDQTTRTATSGSVAMSPVTTMTSGPTGR
jgi:type VI protein secretion system component VasK